MRIEIPPFLQGDYYSTEWSPASKTKEFSGISPKTFTSRQLHEIQTETNSEYHIISCKGVTMDFGIKSKYHQNFVSGVFN